MPSCDLDPTSGVLLGLLVPPSGVKYAVRSRPIEASDDPDGPGRWLSGRKHPPAKRVGGVKLPRGFESLPSRHWKLQVRGPRSPRSPQMRNPLAVVGALDQCA